MKCLVLVISLPIADPDKFIKNDDRAGHDAIEDVIENVLGRRVEVTVNVHEADRARVLS